MSKLVYTERCSCKTSVLWSLGLSFYLFSYANYIYMKIYRNIDNAVKFLKVLKHLPDISDAAYCLGRA